MNTEPSLPFPTPAAGEAPARVLIVDDHPVFRRGIGELIRRRSNMAICGEAEDAHAALEAMRRLHPDVVMLDVSLPGANGIELIKLLLAERPRLRILVVSMHEESLYALRALRAGARGYVMKHQAEDQLLDALRKVVAGGLYVSPALGEKLVFKLVQGSDSDLGSPVDKLSDRELEVLRHFGQGKTTREVAQTLHLSVKTIETHRAHIKEKLGFKDAPEMVKFAGEWVAIEHG
jgi:DNA-binding NarL/FixJ family response regulator